MKELILYAFIFEFLFNTISYILMRIDKLLAKKKKIRISEKTLLTFAVFGPIGTLCAMCFKVKNGRHKNKKFIFWMITLLSCLIHILIFTIIFYLL